MANHIFITGKAVTAGELVDGITGKTNSDSFISTVLGVDIIWDYRTKYPNNYYNAFFHPVCSAEVADYISIYNAGGFGSDKKGDFGKVINKLSL